MLQLVRATYSLLYCQKYWLIEGTKCIGAAEWPCVQMLLGGRRGGVEDVKACSASVRGAGPGHSKLRNNRICTTVGADRVV